MIKDIFPIPAFRDNYIWAFGCAASRSACVVDPGDAEPVLHYLREKQLNLTHVFITHHHADHTGGLATLADRYALTVYGPANSSIKGISHPLHAGDQVKLFDVDFAVLGVPGHTLDHIAYFAPTPGDQQSPLVFCGDTLFAAGCGRVFEGNPKMMYASLQVLAHLDPNTRIYCTHEYTLANLRFAAAVEPDNEKIKMRIELETAKRDRQLPTLPSTLTLEKSTNPFLRCTDPFVAEVAAQKAGRTLQQADEVFAALRSWKDGF